MGRGSWCILLGAWLALTPATAEAPVKPHAVSFTISGGVSLAAYEAGALYYFTTLAQRSPEVLDPRVFTGTSAGSVNAMSAAVSRCRRPVWSPLGSVFYRVFEDVDIDHLFVADKVTANAMFTRDAFVPGGRVLREAWMDGLEAGCDVLVGVTATRMRALQLDETHLPQVPRMTERFLVRITGQGPGRPPLAVNHVSGPANMPRALLPLDGEDAHPFDAITDLLFASTAFPVAFSPQPVGHCLVSATGGPDVTCTPAHSTRALFIDGGFFDNQPLGLAVKAMRNGVIRDGGGNLGLVARAEAGVLPSDAWFFYVDPSLRLTPTMTADPNRPPALQLLPAALDVTLDLANTARSIHLDTLLQNEDVVRDSLLVTRGLLPKASEPLSGFMGFFEHSFRSFDFYLGMYDAHRTAQERLLPRLTEAERARLRFPEDATETTTPDNAPGWRPYRCLRAVLDGDGDPQSCAGEDQRDFRILLQYALERLHDECRKLPSNGPPPPWTDRRCLDAMAGSRPARVPYVTSSTDGWKSQPREADLDHMLRRLAHHQFLFKDLGLSRMTAWTAKARIRGMLSTMVAPLASNQGMLSSVPLRMAAEAGLNTLSYRPARHLLHAVWGPAPEVGFSTTFPDSVGRWLRMSLALQMDGMDSVFSSRTTYVGLTPQAGFELETTFLSNAWVQPRVGVRTGLLFSTGDAFSLRGCDHSRERFTPCSRVLLNGYASISLLNAVRLQVAVQWWPALASGQPHLWSISPGVGLQLPLGI